MAKSLIPYSTEEFLLHIGAVDNKGKFKFTNTDGTKTPFNIDFWSEGEPQGAPANVSLVESVDDSVQNELLCGAIQKHRDQSKVMSIDCSSEKGHAFICEYSW